MDFLEHTFEPLEPQIRSQLVTTQLILSTKQGDQFSVISDQFFHCRTAAIATYGSFVEPKLKYRVLASKLITEN